MAKAPKPNASTPTIASNCKFRLRIFFGGSVFCYGVCAISAFGHLSICAFVHMPFVHLPFGISYFYLPFGVWYFYSKFVHSVHAALDMAPGGWVLLHLAFDSIFFLHLSIWHFVHLAFLHVTSRVCAFRTSYLAFASNVDCLSTS